MHRAPTDLSPISEEDRRSVADAPASNFWRTFLVTTALLGVLALPTSIPEGLQIAGKQLFWTDLLCAFSIARFSGTIGKGARQLLVAGGCIFLARSLLVLFVHQESLQYVIRDARPLIGLSFGITLAHATMANSHVRRQTIRWLTLGATLIASATAFEALTGIKIIYGRVEQLGSIYRVLTNAELPALALAVGIPLLWLARNPQPSGRQFILTSCGLSVSFFGFGRSYLIMIAVSLTLALCSLVFAKLLSWTRVCGVVLLVLYASLTLTTLILVFPSSAAVRPISQGLNAYSKRVLGGLEDSSVLTRDSNESRNLEDSAAISALTEHPILGTGPGAPYRTYFQYEERDPGALRYIHNTPLWMALRFGPTLAVLIALSMLAPLVHTLYRAERFGPSAVIAASMAIGMFAQSLVSPSLLSYGGSIVFGALIGFVLVVRRRMTIQDPTTSGRARSVASTSARL